MHDNKDTALANAVLMLNCEHTSIAEIYQYGPVLRQSNNIHSRRWWVNGSDTLASIVLGAYKTFGVTIFEDRDPSAPGDMGSVARDLPSIQLIVSPVYYHSDHDRPAGVAAVDMEAVARAYAKIIDEANKLPRADLQPSAPMRGR